MNQQKDPFQNKALFHPDELPVNSLSPLQRKKLKQLHKKKIPPEHIIVLCNAGKSLEQMSQDLHITTKEVCHILTKLIMKGVQLNVDHIVSQELIKDLSEILIHGYTGSLKSLTYVCGRYISEETAMLARALIKYTLKRDSNSF